MMGILADRMRAWELVNEATSTHFWLRRVDTARRKSICDMVMSEAAVMVSSNTLPYTREETRKLLKQRVGQRLKSNVGNPLLLFILFQVLGTIISLVVQELYEKWRKKREEEDDPDPEPPSKPWTKDD